MNGRVTRTEASLTTGPAHERLSPGFLLQSIYLNDFDTVESWIPSPNDISERFRYIWTIPSTCMLDSHELMAESWIASLSDLNHLTLESLVSSSMDYCYGATSCFDRSNNQFLHSLFKEHEPWNRNFPTNNIELKKPARPTLGFKFVWQNIPRMFC